MKRSIIWITPVVALASCVGNPAIVGVGDEDGGSGDVGEEDDDDGNDSESPGDDDDDGTGDDADGPSDDDGSDDTGPAPVCAGVDAFGSSPFATLTPSQYDATVRDLTGAVGPFAVGQVAAIEFAGFAFAMDTTDAGTLATEVAAAVDLDALLPCDSTITDADEQQACFDAFAPDFARLAWRRALVPGDLVGVTTAFGGGGDFDTRMRAVIQTVLADERFLSVSRDGTPDAGDPELVTLDAHALATRLALFLWNSGPDEQLLDLADSGELLDPAVLHAQAERLFADARAARMVDDFHAQWLDIEDLAEVTKDPVLFPEFDAALGRDMLRGTLAFARSIVLDGSGRLRDLLTQPTSFANANLAAIYGDDIVGAAPGGATFEAIQLDPERRGGLFSEPSFATRHSREDQIGFTRRGKSLLETTFCTPVPPPPPGSGVDLPEVPADAPHKEVWAEVIGDDPTCAGCHSFADPPGFAFDNYDPIGRWTSTIDGFPVDTSGTIDDMPFANRTELIEIVLGHDGLGECMAQKYTLYALDRFLIPDVDGCTIDSLATAFDESDGNVRVLALAIVDSDAFRVVRGD